MTVIEKRLLLAFYEWCIQETERELERNCETLVRLNNSWSSIYIEFVRAFADQNVARAAALALVKRFHLPALKLKSEALTDGDRGFIDDFISFARFKRFAGHARLRVGTGKDTPKIQLTEKLNSLLNEILGKAALLEGGVRRYETSAGQFRVATYVDVGGRLPLRYSHKIITRSGRTLIETSLLHWHGIATDTSWEVIPPHALDENVKLLAELSQRLFRGVEVIVSKPAREQ